MFKNISFTISELKINIKTHNQATQPHNQVHRILHKIIQCISITIKSLLSNRIDHNLPPPKNQSQVSNFFNAFSFLNDSESSQSIKYMIFVTRHTQLYIKFQHWFQLIGQILYILNLRLSLSLNFFNIINVIEHT